MNNEAFFDIQSTHNNEAAYLYAYKKEGDNFQRIGMILSIEELEELHQRIGIYLDKIDRGNKSIVANYGSRQKNNPKYRSISRRN